MKLPTTGGIFKFIGVPAILIMGILMIAPMMMGVNDAGQRTVIQYPNGKLFVKFDSGWYPQWFGKTTEYNDLITFDFDRDASSDGNAAIDQPGISVRYQDGGMGTVFGKSRYSLPTDEATMIALHKAFRSNNGVANKLIKPVTEEAMNLTAGLMTSEDAYATKRAIFTELAKEQVSKGKYQTYLKNTVKTDEATGKTVSVQIPVIKTDENTGMPIHVDSDFKSYGIEVKGFQLNDPGFEKTTLAQISQKREATMAIITAKANAERAKQEAITAEEDGKRDVMKAKYEKEVIKEMAVVDASRVAEVAVIKAQQQVDVAEEAKKEALVRASQKVEVAAQEKLEAVEKKLAAVEYEKEQTFRGKGDGAYKRQVYQADGALQSKLDTYENVMARFASAIEKQKWVPEVQMGGSDSAGGNEASNLINLFTATTLKQLGLDMEMKTAIPRTN